ncbi:MAG: efflux RND transporter periplasmic adaptor subunit [Syntrophaceae bacterium]|nr:efflux RND transporter periplasmic adaptor subunit [Syntrophaceae bacterium]
MKLMKYLTFCLLITFPLAEGCGSKESASVNTPSKSQASVSEERLVDAVEVVSQPISYTLSAVGSLKSPEEVTISPKKAGIIEKILVKEGDRVRKGQVLVQLDDIDARLEVERAEAKVKEAEASLETDRRTLSRYQRLLESKVIPQQTYDDLVLKVALDEARLALARTELNQARQNLSDRQIFSPIDGIINLKIASLGEHVNVAPKDEILKIVQMDPLDLEFYVPENWVGKIRLGEKVHFSVRAFSEERFSATIQFISPTADPSTRNVRMKAVVPNPHHRLKPGFFAEVSVRTGGNPNAIVIPESALVSQEGKFFSFVVRDGVAHRREVETGLRFDGRVEILKGIEKGEQVVVTGHEQLSEGTRVRISTHVQAPNPK